MLKLEWIEIFLRCIPETLITIWGVHIIAKEHLQIKKYLISSILLGVCMYLIRLLPIYFGVHTILSIVFLVSAMYFIGIPVIKAIYGFLIMLTILSLSEYFNLLILQYFGVDTSFSNVDALHKSILVSPSLILFALFTWIIYYFFKMKEGKKNGKLREFGSRFREKI